MVGTAFTYGFVSDPPNICGFGSIFLYTVSRYLYQFDILLLSQILEIGL